MSDTRATVVELLIAAPIDDVWHALRDREALTSWFGWNHEGLPEEIDYIFLTHATADASTYTLRLNQDEFTLEPRGADTIVRLTRAAPAGGSWDDVYDEIAEGWRTFIHQLRFTLERHRGQTRRTLYLSGRARHEGEPRLPDALGLPAFAAASPVGLATFVLPTGEPTSAEVWFSHAWQVGVALDAYGGGLLVSMRRPPSSKSPFGSGMLVLTTYGLDQAAHDALTRQWRDWADSVCEVVTLQT